jgi:hypothetical protein
MIDFVSSAWVILLVFTALFTVASFTMEAVYKIIIIVFLFVIGLTSYRSINSRAGLPVIAPAFDKKEVLVLGYHVEQYNDKIYIWMKTAENKPPKSFVFNYDKETHEELRKQRAKHKGKAYYKTISTKKKGVIGRLKDGSVIKFNQEILGGSLPLK